MHAESYEILAETADRIQAARDAGRPILAIGTTAVRALEDAALRAAEAGSANLVLSGKAEARLFIVPDFGFVSRKVCSQTFIYRVPRCSRWSVRLPARACPGGVQPRRRSGLSLLQLWRLPADSLVRKKGVWCFEMILRVPHTRNCNNPLAADTGSCQRRVSAAKTTSREATPECSLSLVPWNGVTEFPRLLAEDENTSLACKANFLTCPFSPSNRES